MHKLSSLDCGQWMATLTAHWVTRTWRSDIPQSRWLHYTHSMMETLSSNLSLAFEKSLSWAKLNKDFVWWHIEVALTKASHICHGPLLLACEEKTLKFQFMVMPVCLWIDVQTLGDIGYYQFQWEDDYHFVLLWSALALRVVMSVSHKFE